MNVSFFCISLSTSDSTQSAEDDCQDKVYATESPPIELVEVRMPFIVYIMSYVNCPDIPFTKTTSPFLDRL